MGKSTKQGKARRDIFYRRAKEAGYRARASYKLIQLNKKFNFLQKSRVCIDLCAAPGSWMQVCSKFMPVSSVIIGVDLHPIHHIPNTLSIQGDITTESVRQELKKNLKTWKADLVLHDGAPNVGQNWLHDAYQQNLLVLHSFKLACEFLQKGGTFITKIFRSKDHLSLQYVFRKLFRTVEATKPIASRMESAEMFVVCQGFFCPDKIDPKFFEAQHVFQSLEEEPKQKIDILHPEKTKRKPEGYEEGVTMLYKKNKISEFIKSSKFLEILEQTNEFEWDLDFARQSSKTTNDVVEFCKDIKVLGRKEIRTLLNWRKAIKAEIEEAVKQRKETLPVIKKAEDIPSQPDEEELDDEDQKEIDAIREQIALLKADKDKEDKRLKKKLNKKKKKLEEKMQLRLMVPGDPGPQESGESQSLFSLNSISKAKSIDDIVDKTADYLADSDAEDDEEDQQPRSKYEYRTKGNLRLDSTGTRYKSSDESDTEDENEYDSFSEDEGLNLEREEKKSSKKIKKLKKKVSFADQMSDEESDTDLPPTITPNPILTDLVGDELKNKKERKAEKWFSNELFEDLEKEDIEDYEVEKEIRKDDSGKRQDAFKEVDDAPNSSDSELDSGLDSDTDSKGKRTQGDSKSTKDIQKKKGPSLTPVGLALATQMIRSKKTMRDMYDKGWNRYMTGDEDLPDWFAEDEKMHNNPGIQINKEDLQMYEDRENAVDSKTIKKVVEAKARKLRRAKKRLAKARKKATEITNNEDMTAREKAVQLQKIYKTAAATKKKEKTYVVMKKNYGGKKPKGIKGPSRMVDRRMKKDKRAAAKLRDTKGRGGKRKR